MRPLAAAAAVISVLAAALALPSAESARTACPYQAQVITYNPRGQSIQGAYGDGGTAAKACSPQGAYTWCAPQLPGAAFNAGWKTFETW